MDEQKHAIARTHRITSSRIGTIASGDFKAWNTLAEKMRNASPAPIHSKGATGVAPLDWGRKHEDWICAQFWLRHPEYDMHDERWCYWHQPENTVLWRMCGTSPDRALYQSVDGFDSRVAILETKCPWRQEIHRAYREAGELPKEYAPQMYWHLMVSDAPHGWFVSGDPRIKEDDLNYFELRIERDRSYEATLMMKVNRFIGGYLSGERFRPTEHNRTTYQEIF